MFFKRATERHVTWLLRETSSTTTPQMVNASNLPSIAMHSEAAKESTFLLLLFGLFIYGEFYSLLIYLLFF
jgi:hypothetical protein